MKWVNFWEKRTYPPVVMIPVSEATIFGFSKKFPSSLTKIGNYWRNGISDYFYVEKEINKTVDDILKKAFKKPGLFDEYFLNAYKIIKKLRIESDKFVATNLTKKSTDELINFHTNFYKEYLKFYSFATIFPLVGYKEDNLLYSKANEILKEKIKNEPHNFSNYYVILTNPPKKLIPAEQDLKILEMARKAKKKGIKNKKQLIKHLGDEIEKIYEKYKWLSFNFCDSIGWDLNYYIDLVLDKIKTNIAKEIRFIINYEDKTKKDFNKLAKKLTLEREELKYFKLIKNLGFYKWKRQYEFQKAVYNYEFVLDELGRRCGLTTLEAKYLLKDEWHQAIKKPKVYKKIVRERIKSSLIMVDKNKGTQVLTGKKAKKAYKKLQFAQKIDINMKELKGMPAQSGQAKGIVKIVNTTKDLAKMKEGDILISRATMPDLLPGMKKASAIITDDGGITCHAAIVSRELKIPCIVGTKVATKILKNGDRVEIDASQGIIKIITRK